MSEAPDWLPDTPRKDAPPWTPTRVNRTVKDHLLEIGRLTVLGEICDFRGASASGHLYFGLRDRRSRLPAVMWRSSASRLRFEVENGLEVLATGRVDLYAEGIISYENAVSHANDKSILDQLEQFEEEYDEDEY